MNLPAAIGLAQLEKIDEQLQIRSVIAASYNDRLASVEGIVRQTEQSWAQHVYWMFSVVLDPEIFHERDRVMRILADKGIETRPIFYPAHSMPPYLKSVGGEKFPVAENLAQNGISLPTWAGLTENQIDAVCDALKTCRK